MNKFICFVAGKSGGHLLPCLTLAQKICSQNPTTKILFFSNRSMLERAIIKNYDCITIHNELPLSSLSLKPLFIAYPLFCVTFLFSLCVSLFKLIQIRPIKIITTGGAESLPVCYAGAMMNIPIEIVELNAIPGKTVAALAPYATTISTCFATTQKYFQQKTYLTEYPLRFCAKARINPAKARIHLNLNPSKKTIFVLGGSQGSLFLNNVIADFLEQTTSSLKEQLQIIHQIGSQDPRDWKSYYEKIKVNAYIFTFYHALEYCYSAADLIICRAGAGTLFEVQFFNKPCITIPLETASTNHQIDNALAFHSLNQKRFIVARQHDAINAIKIIQKLSQHYRHIFFITLANYSVYHQNNRQIHSNQLVAMMDNVQYLLRLPLIPEHPFYHYHSMFFVRQKDR